MKRPGMLFGGFARKRIGLLLGLLLLTLNLIWLWNLPIGQGDEPIRVRIERGSNFSQVVQQLREANLIQQPLWFEFLARLNGQHHRLQAGEFQLDPRWNHAALLNHLVSGSGLQVRVTIPEGLSYQQATARLVEQGLGQADRYDELFTDSTLRKLSGIQGLKTLEGVIYPETYFIAQESSEREILGLMIQEFNNRFTQLRSETPAEGGKKLSDHQLLVLASMIGFGSMAQDVGLSMKIAVGSSLGIWGLPGQVAMIELMAIGLPTLSIVIASSLANMRFMPMTIVAMPLFKGNRSALKYRYFLAQSCLLQRIRRRN